MASLHTQEELLEDSLANSLRDRQIRLVQERPKVRHTELENKVDGLPLNPQYKCEGVPKPLTDLYA
jgi:hypothetical protein